MKDSPLLLRPQRHSSGGQTPARQSTRVSDDILAYITPASALDALTYPIEPLRTCLDEASAAEKEFALRTAAASRKVWEWVEELSKWSWPSEGGSAGFEPPEGTARRLFVNITAPPEEDQNAIYMGSLRSDYVARYGRRIDEVHAALDELAVDEIKRHVMTNHIMPLSRPATPILGLGKTSGAAYNRMEDLTAVVTAIVLQTLPNLARLSGLLQVWGIRVVVLRHIPGLLRAIEEAEVALRSGWTAITSRAGSDGDAFPTLSRSDFQVMRSVIEKKVTVPARTLDYMLDRLEGLTDTLPDIWLDRMEAVECGYGDWVAASERRIAETAWAKANQTRTSDGALALPLPIAAKDDEEPSKRSRGARQVSNGSTVSTAPSEATLKPPGSPPQELPRLQLANEPDGVYEEVPRLRIPPPIREETAASPRRSHKWNAEDDMYAPDDEFGSDMIGDDSEIMELPPLINSDRRESDVSQNSTMLHGASSSLLSDEPPEVSASPALNRPRNLRLRPQQGGSPPSSPPMGKPGARSSSAVPHDDSSVMENDDATLPRTPVEDSSFSEYFGESMVSDVAASPSVRPGSSGDQQLRQQISDIIDSIPAKIKLTTEPPNLNPPDLQLPRLRKQPSKDLFKRSLSSVSNMSSRTTTPSFTLSPAKNARPRSQRGQQEIKVYHLARSTGEAPIKLFIRCVGENGERVMVRVGGGWADLSEYLKEYASHHGRRSKGNHNAKVEISDAPRGSGLQMRSSPPSRPASALEATPMSPLAVRKTRRSMGAAGNERPRLRPTTPGPLPLPLAAPSSEDRSTRSRSSSRLSWVEDDSSFLGLAGPTGRKVEMSEENKAWVESVKEKVRLASGERKIPGSKPYHQVLHHHAPPQPQPPPQQSLQAVEDYNKSKFGELGRVGGTKRLFRQSQGQGQQGQGSKK